MNKRNQKGVTLIALIITIIVMLILVAVVVRTAINSGLFGHAKDATQKWADRQDKEANIGNDNSIRDTFNQYSTVQDRSGLKIGDYVTYTPDTAENYMGFGTSENENENPSGSANNPADGIPQDTTLIWRIMNINNDGSVDIVSDMPIASSVYLKGSLGFNNGVLLLNDLCKEHYSNSTLGTIARSINLEDAENKFNSTGVSARDSYAGYGSIITLGTRDDDRWIPNIYDYVEKTTQAESQNYYTSPTRLTASQKEKVDVKITTYSLNLFSQYFINPEYANAIFGERNRGDYWLATRAVYNQARRG